MGGQENAYARAQAIGFGALLIVLGLVFLIGTFIPGLTIGKLWPLFMLIPVFNMFPPLLVDFKKNYGVLFPIGLLVYLTVFFIVMNYTGWNAAAVHWPQFLLAVASGFVLLYLAKPNSGLLVPVFVLLAIAVVWYTLRFNASAALAVCLILAGVMLVISTIVRSFQKKK